MKEEHQSYKKRENMVGVRKWGFHQRYCVCHSVATSWPMSSGASGLKAELMMPNQAGTLLRGSGVGILIRGWRQAIEGFLGYFFLKYLSGSNIEQAAVKKGRQVRRFCSDPGRRSESPATA